MTSTIATVDGAKTEVARRRLPRRAVRGLGVVAALAVGLTGVMGFAHTRPGRPLLQWMGMAAHGAGGACPFGYGTAGSAEHKEAVSRAFAATHAGKEAAAALPALGFELGRTRRADVEAWARSFGIACKHPRLGGDLDCSDVPDAALPEGSRGAAVSSVWLTFGSGDVLLQVGVMRRSPDVEAASRAYQAVLADVTRRAGSAAEAAVTGDGSASSLRRGMFNQSSAELRFRNYYALVRVTNMGPFFTLSEDYRLLPTT